MEVKTIEVPYLKSHFSGLNVYVFSIKIDDLLSIQYVAARGVSTEDGAVQRILNRKRIQSIKDFVIKGNTFFNTFILNWTDKEYEPKILKEVIKIPLQGRRAQIIDGQHRLMGLQAAINEKPEIGKEEILVTMCMHLDTKNAATIFLNINSEQKPVPKSLIYDLFGEAVEDKEHSINRAKDIADFLHQDDSSPFQGKIKYPGNQRGEGVLDLAIVVNSLKPHLETDGVFHRNNLSEINTQQRAILNFFLAIKDIYDIHGYWDNRTKNPFFKAAGFNGAIEFLTEDLLAKCQIKKSFKVHTFSNIMNLDEDSLILASDIKSMDGKSARKEVKSFFINAIRETSPDNDEYEF